MASRGDVRSAPSGEGLVDLPNGELTVSRDEEQSLLHRVLSGPVTWIFLILVAMVIVFSLMHPGTFSSETNFRNISVNASTLIILGVGATFVIITAGIDLSVASVLVFAGVIAAKVMVWLGGESSGVIALGLAAAMASGCGWGIVNGVLIAKAKVPSFIVTLGTLGMALGFAYIISGGVDVRDTPTRLVDTIGIGDAFGQVPYVVLIAAVIALAGGWLLSATRFGRYTYAIGSNIEAAKRAGINVDRHLIKVYAFAGLLAGVAGFLSLARFGSTTIGGHQTEVFQVISAVVLGGTSLFGGVGWVAGTVVGVFIPVVLTNGFVISGVEPFWQQVAVGAILIGAVYLDQRRRARYRT